MSSRVFLITGSSTGFGRDYVQEILDRGDRVVATARNVSALEGFSNATPGKNFLATRLDVLDKSSITDAFAKTIETFGRVDVVVNNAGYGLAGALEDLTDEEMRRQMDINFFGLIDVTRAALPIMRDVNKEPRGGLIQQITSIGGQRGAPMFSLYCASKWAVEGMTEALSHELKPEWNIKLSLIEPGGFRTDWAGRSMAFAEPTHKEAYDHIDAKTTMTNRNGKQAGDPKKGAKVMYEFATMADPPLRVVVGTDAYAAILKKIEAYSENYKKYEALSTSTDVEGYVAP